LLQTFLLAEDSKLIENEFVLFLKTTKVKTVTKLTTNSIQNANKLMKPSKVKFNWNIQPKIIMLSLSKSIWSVITKSDLKNFKWIKEFMSTIRERVNEKLIRSIISKVSKADWNISSINNILKKLAKVTLEIGTKDKLLKILA